MVRAFVSAVSAFARVVASDVSAAFTVSMLFWTVEIAAWRADIAHHVPPGGESLSQMAQRAHAFAQELTARHPEDPDCEIVLMTHVGIIQTLPRMLLGEPLRGFAGNPIDYGSITRLVLRDGRFERDGTNMTP